PESGADLLDVVGGAGSDVAVLAAYGQLIRPEVLGIPDHGFVNVHYSVLPRWRGASPVVRAILAGDDETGVSLMEMDEGLDTGPVIATARRP
ncbi:MAG: methionyl-tRNA formyltransferase, partial [Actinobacteria bacterium]|nr:methionyl-tRNA formyltransferase [Actinomycetota bacterium]NIV24429.1 methionyl-tRNA formyltransferase [Gemmatimonadota bacterium]NIS34329.1 methionyl-tRNA formyltransferase [Actinomycetota bacterium]NIT97397.1 methionyl-tRNA formyltransferase [Actinomycetota bacterium]NIU21066.1 methionyl-tRNA formyltransferase [Actinomycetota bacterium]